MSHPHLCLGQIAVVDDTPANLHLLSQLLEEAGYDVRLFPRGHLALEGINYSLPDLILLDIQMPGINGYQVCEQLKANELTRNIPVIFISALHETFDKVKAFRLGGVDYISKPFQSEEVLARVATHLELYQMKRNLEATNQIQSQQIIEQNRQLIQLNQALEKANQELQKNYEQLQKAQLQLVQTEKMATLGNLVAGIGHEINNPLACIGGNFNFLSSYIDSLLGHLDLYQAAYPPTVEIQKNAEKIDLGYFREDWPNLLSSMEQGINRLNQISASLRIFSRSDLKHHVPFDINEGLESTLLILQHRLKANQQRPDIQVIKKYGDLPKVNCFPGPLNQVFMNLLANAIDALDECMSDRGDREISRKPLQIQIETEAIYPQVIVRISDRGVGMSEAVKQRIFDPGFTTKPVGKGTGLGMAIAHQIITEKHGGKIECESILGQGTVFTIALPMV